MRIGERSNLRQMCHDEDLMCGGKLGESAPYSHCSTPPYPGIDLVEDKDRHLVRLPEHSFQGKHHTRQLTSRSDLRQRPGRLIGCRGKEELRALRPIGRPLMLKPG